MIGTLKIYKLLTPWQHGEELDDAVFRVAATLPVHALRGRNYKIEGDELYGFDPNAFVQRLIDETGISHVWEPVRTKLPEGGLSYSYSSVEGQDPDIAAKHNARNLLWEIWRRFANLDEMMSHGDKVDEVHAFRQATAKFDAFVRTNIDLVRQVEDGFRKDRFPQLATLKELEQKAQRPF